MGYLTVSVILGNNDTVIRKIFHCPTCGKSAAEVNGEVMTISNGDLQSEVKTRSVIVMCKFCRTRIVFLD